MSNISRIALAWSQLDFQYKHKRISSPLDEKIIRFLISKHEKKIINSLDTLIARQIYQVYLFKNELISSVKLIESAKLQLSSNDQKPISSKLQSEVTTYLRYLFPEIVWEEEYFMKFTSLDIAYPEKKLVLQVNGPSHYEGRELNPSTQFNNYLLEKEEWKLVTIPYFEWDLLKTRSKKNAYIKKKLKPYSIQNNSENSIMYLTSKEAKLTMRQCDQATVNKNTSVYDRCA